MNCLASHAIGLFGLSLVWAAPAAAFCLASALEPGTRFEAARALCEAPGAGPADADGSAGSMAPADALDDVPAVLPVQPLAIPFTARPPVAAGGRAPARAGAAAPVATPGAHRFEPALKAVARAYRIDPRLLHAVVRQESGYRPDAVSSKGALGLMQIMPATGRELGVSDPALLVEDPLLNLVTGARYLKRMQARFGNDLPRVLAAYNAGPGAVARHGGIPPYAETRAYVAAVLNHYRRQMLTAPL